MIKSATALFALLVIFAAGSAIAQDSTTKPGVTGTVQSIDPVTRMVVLDDGRTYHMRKDADVSMVTKGASIALACDTEGANCMVITAGPPNDAVPESQTSPGAGGKGQSSSN